MPIPLLEPLFQWYYSSAPAPTRKKTKDMKIFCVGMSRSGTDSLSQALRILGYDKVYHGWDFVKEPNDFVTWRKLYDATFRGKEGMTQEDWDGLLGDCEAVSDQHCAVFATQLMDKYPNAKVILNIRDVDAWHASCLRTFSPIIESRWIDFLWHFNRDLWLQFDVFVYRLFGDYFGGDFRKNGKERYERHVEDVKRYAKEHGREMLEWRVTEGWGPLCGFLGKEVPVGLEFPNGNGTPEFEAEFWRVQGGRVKRAMWNLGLISSVGAAVVAAGVWQADALLM